MSDPKEVKKSGFGAFTAMERQRKAAREMAERATETVATTVEPITATLSEPASVPWPRPYSLRAEPNSDLPPATDGRTPQGPQ
jgi:hypothetical protein